jgi:hypothetical protein
MNLLEYKSPYSQTLLVQQYSDEVTAYRRWKDHVDRIGVDGRRVNGNINTQKEQCEKDLGEAPEANMENKLPNPR